MPLASPAFFRRRRVAIQHQAESAECGLACLAMIMTFHGQRVDVDALRRRWPVSLKGVNARQLLQMATEAGFTARALRLELEELERLETPCILHWNLDHFLVLEKVTRGQFLVADPAVGRRKLGRAVVSQSFTGVALELTPASGFARKAETRPLRLGRLLSGSKNLIRPLVQLFLLSLALQGFMLLTPFYSQVVIDDIVVSGDVDLLRLVALSFTGLALFIALTAAIRSWLVVYISALLDFGWSSALFGHLVRLPFDYFEKRHVGDIQSRFASLEAVRNLVTTQVVEAVIDGLMAVTTLAVMMAYSLPLSLLPMAAVLAYLVVRTILHGPVQAATRDLIVRKAQRDSYFLETLRGILPIRNFGTEAVRKSGFEARNADTVAAAVDVGRLGVWQRAASQAIFGVENVAVIWIAAAAIINGGLTVGMMVAFLAYKAHFSARSAALVDKYFQLRLLRVHLERLRDIVDTPVDESAGACSITAGPVRSLEGRLELRRIRFRYGYREPYVLRDVSLTVEKGEHVAIAGPSGCGKSTLMKLMVGLIEPTSGELLVDGRPLSRGAIADYRSRIGVVMQDDQLLSGTLIDNVAFSEARPDLERIEACCSAAGIMEEIRRMPMGLYTLVGDMGDVLSGGQKQRLLLARALYRQPSMLFLDEATSHLDGRSETALVKRICELDITRIVIAHRAETLRHADRVVSLGAA
jgi:ATP-binding cassette subfamily B protein RaxB